jgi:hypothetical protein
MSPYLDPSTHDDRISITVNLAVLSTGGATFRPLLVGKDITLGAVVSKEYTSVVTAQADLAAGEINAWTLAAITEIFGQSPRPASLLVAEWDDAGGDTIADALTAALADNSDFYCICIEDRTAADHVVLSGWIDTQEAAGSKFVTVIQSADADWLTTGGVPAGYSTIDDKERVFVVYHGTDAAPRAEGLAGNRLARSPDDKSVPWNSPVAEVYSFTADTPTQAQKEFARTNNGNTLLPMGTIYDAYCDPGRNLNSRAFDQIITADWFETRLNEGLADLNATLAANGEKLGVNADGQNRVAGTIGKVALTGVTAGHFEKGQVVITPETITAADRTAQQLRFTVGAQNVVGAIAIDVTVNLSTTAIV